MSASTIIAAGQRAAEALMVDSCVIQRMTGEALDENDLTVPVYTTVFTGPCRVKFEGTRVEGRELAEQILVAQMLTLLLPYATSAGVKVDDIVQIAGQGLTVRVAGLFAQTYATARRFPVEAIS